MTRLLLLMVGVGQRLPNLWAGSCLRFVIVEKSTGGLTERVVDSPGTGWWQSIGGEGGRRWSWSWRLVLLWPGIGEALGLHAVIGNRHPLTINREQAPPHSLLDVTANVVVAAAEISAENNILFRWNKLNWGTWSPPCRRNKWMIFSFSFNYIIYLTGQCLMLLRIGGWDDKVDIIDE